MINLQKGYECKQCLKDCGCGEEQYKEYMELVKSDDKRGQIIFLRRQRSKVMIDYMAPKKKLTVLITL